jgi:hypothetical protein
MARDYSKEKPLSKADQDAARKRAKTNHRTLYAISVDCRDEEDQAAMFRRLSKVAGGRKLKVVVS